METMGRRRYHLLYDGGCRYCRFFMKLVSFLDIRRAFAPVELQSPCARTLLSGVGADLVFKSFHLVDADGVVYSGPEAMPLLFSVLAGLRFMDRVVLVCPVSNTLRFSYKLLARVTSLSRCSRVE